MRRSTLALIVIAVAPLAGQTAPSQAPGARPGYDIAFIGPPMADPVLQHAKETYVVFGCAYCHGLYLVTRGEATDLMHSRLVARDVDANVIGPLLRAGIPQTAKLSPMPQFSDLSDQQVSDIARWIHYARQQGRLQELTQEPLSGGDATAGRAFFNETCSGCHSTERDLAHIGANHNAVALRASVIQPASLEAQASYQVEQLHEPRRQAGRDRHHVFLETCTASQVANLVAYLQTLK